MRVVNLVENMPGMPGCVPAHGLSFYIEANGRRLLMDAGPGAMLTANAAALDVDLSGVDAVVLSHGHYDHADGLAAFCEVNATAPVYLRRTAGGGFYGDDGPGGLRYIGVDPAVLRLPRLVWVDGCLELDRGMVVFGDIQGRRNWPEANLRLRKRTVCGVIQDGFDHEQCLAVEADGLRTLFSGCAHSGILNILDRYADLFGGMPDVVFSGFHMKKKSDYTDGEEDTIRRTAEALAELQTLFYTCHCTGLPAFDLMKPIMGEKLRYIHCGESLCLGR